jgi:hypothetical protein
VSRSADPSPPSNREPAEELTLRAEFHRRDDGSEVVGAAWWDGRRVHVESDDEEVRGGLERIFRLTPVVVDDPAFRSLGAHGETVLEPGSLEWFEAAAFARAGAEGLSVRMVPELMGQGGWDPAAAYRTFRSTIRRLVT